MEWSSGLARSASFGRGLLLVGLLFFVQAQSPHAVLNIFWRYAVLSFDNPATQTLDELACATAPYTDPGGEARESTRVLVSPSGRVLPPQAPGLSFRPALSSGITRSPPAA